MSLVVLTYRTIFAVVDVGCDFKIASNVVYVCEFVTNLLTEAQHICGCSVRKPVKLETSRDTTPAFLQCRRSAACAPLCLHSFVDIAYTCFFLLKATESRSWILIKHWDLNL